jgi:hypothetical protein
VHSLDDDTPVIVSRPGRRTADTKAPSGDSDQPPIGPRDRSLAVRWRREALVQQIPWCESGRGAAPDGPRTSPSRPNGSGEFVHTPGVARDSAALIPRCRALSSRELHRFRISADVDTRSSPRRTALSSSISAAICPSRYLTPGTGPADREIEHNDDTPAAEVSACSTRWRRSANSDKSAFTVRSRSSSCCSAASTQGCRARSSARMANS